MDIHYLMQNVKNGKPFIIEDEKLHCGKLEYIVWLQKFRKLISITIDTHCFLINQYLLHHNLFQNIKIKIPDKLWGLESAAYTLNHTQDYLFILGGLIAGDCIFNEQKTKDIYFIDLMNMTLFKSKIKCPTHGPMRAICMIVKSKNNLKVFGFVHEYQRNNQYENFPVYLINIISEYFYQEYVYIFCNNNNYDFWIIDIEQIINNFE